MNTISRLIAALSLLALAGCDAVQVPGLAPNNDIDAPSDIEPIEAPAPPEEPALPMIESLAEIGASNCLLPPDSEPTLTITQLNAPVDPASEEAEDAEDAEPEEAPPPPDPTPEPDPFIIATSLDELPGLVSLLPMQFRDNGDISVGRCGAVRIADNWFLTAAHCLDQGFDEIRIVAGTTNLRETETALIFNADAAVCHGEYRGSEGGLLNDLALVHVADDTLATIRNVPVAAYGAPDQPLSPLSYAEVTMAGWGSSGYGAPPSDRLLSGPLTLVGADPGTILAKGVQGAGACEGDSGGPLYVTEEDGQRRVVGVLSSVRSAVGEVPCAGEYLGRYTNLSGYSGWIETVMTYCETYPDLCETPTDPEVPVFEDEDPS
jgi:hypothetical protein